MEKVEEVKYGYDYQRELADIWERYHFSNQNYPKIVKCEECQKWSYRYIDSKDCVVCAERAAKIRAEEEKNGL
jgi:hypothetical protein